MPSNGSPVTIVPVLITLTVMAPPSTSALKNRRCAGLVITKPPLLRLQPENNSGTSNRTAAAGDLNRRARRERLMNIPWAMGGFDARCVEFRRRRRVVVGD